MCYTHLISSTCQLHWCFAWKSGWNFMLAVEWQTYLPLGDHRKSAKMCILISILYPWTCFPKISFLLNELVCRNLAKTNTLSKVHLLNPWRVMADVGTDEITLEFYINNFLDKCVFAALILLYSKKLQITSNHWPFDLEPRYFLSV